MPLQGAAGAKPQASFLFIADNCVYLADPGAAMADGVAVGDLLVLVRLDEEVGPRPAEYGLRVRLQLGAVLFFQPAVEEAAVVVGGGGDVQRALLAALDLETGDAGRANRT